MSTRAELRFGTAALTAALMAAAGLTAVAYSEPPAALLRVAEPPLGLPALPLPISAAPAAEAVDLGRALFFDARLSANARVSCGTCHRPDQAFAQTDRRTPVGASGKPLPRNAPTILNAAYLTHLMQDGEAHSLESQILAPLFLIDEMGNTSIREFVDRVASLPGYTASFGQAFGEPVSIGTIGKALASYERTLLSANAPFDRWRYGGEETALSAEAKDGFTLFIGKAGCSACHEIGERDALFTDQQFHNTGIGSRALPDPNRPADLGREAVSHDPADRFKYRTPSLRNAARTAPYMHDGSIVTLADVVRFYNAGGNPNPGLDPLIHPLGLTQAEMAHLVALLESLTGDNLGELASEAGAGAQ